MNTFKFLPIIMLTVLLTFSAYCDAEDDKDYTQYDTFRFTVNNKDAKTLTNNMRNHIKKYHVKGELKAKIYNVLYGENANDLIWVMGPVSFSEFDSLPDNKKHDNDWADNINPYITSYKQSEIWRNMDGLMINNRKKKDDAPEKYITRYLTINSDQDEDDIKYLLNQVKMTLDKTGKVKYWAVMENKFIQGNLNGRHLMAISSMESWAELDKDWEFAKHFDALYGKGSIKAFADNWSKVFKNQWQEIIVVNKKMSGL